MSEQQLRQWFECYFGELWRLVARLGVAPHQVDDIVQETFIVASRRHEVIEEGAARSFLRSVAIRLSANHRRLSSVRFEVVMDSGGGEGQAEPGPGAERLLEQRERRQLLEEALRCLSNAQRDVFVLYELEGHSVPEIAELLELPAGTVASRLGRGRARFTEAAQQLRRRSRRKEGVE